MDLTNAIVGFDYASTMSQVQIAVAAKMLHTEQSQGASVINLIDAADKNVSTAGDALTAAATGLGSALDTYA